MTQHTVNTEIESHPVRHFPRRGTLHQQAVVGTRWSVVAQRPATAARHQDLDVDCLDDVDHHITSPD